MSDAFEKLTKRLNIPQIKISPYNHRANGVVERGHYILREAIIKSCKGKINDWPTKVQEMVFADRITTNKVTGFSPYQLLHAMELILPMDLAEATFMIENFRSGISTADLLVLRAQQLARHPEDIAKAAETLKQHRFMSKEQFEKRFHRQLSHTIFNPGDLVLVRNSAIEMSRDKKSKQRYLGPYQVEKRTMAGNYRLKELDGTSLKLKYGARRLIPFISRNHHFMREQLTKDTDDSDSDSLSDSDNSGMSS